MKRKTILALLLCVLLGHFPALIQAAPTAKRDLNGDGKADVVWRNFYSGENYLYPMDGKQILATEGYVRTVADQDWNLAGFGDFNGDGRADLLWRNRTTGQNYIYFMNGTQIASEGYLRTVADSAWQVVGIGDFDNDNRDDILWRNSATGENYIYLMDGLAIKPTEGYARTVNNLAWQVAGVGDADGDGNADIFWRNSSTGENYLYPMSETTVLGTEGYLRGVQDLNWTIAGVGDMNGDGTADVLWRNGSTGENYLYPMSGTAILSAEGYLRTVADRNWRILMVADFDGNGTADILWRNASSGENYIYFMDGSTILPTEGFIRSVAEPSWQAMPYANAWTKRAEGGHTISAVARSGSTFVALTEENLLPGKRVLRSTDGYTWSHPAYTGSPSFGDIVFGNNLFVAVGDSPVQVATSPDGVTWTTRLLCFACQDLFAVAWSGSAFVAVGEAGIVRRSTDGITWSAPTTPPPLGAGTLTKLLSVAASATTFVAAGMDHATLKGALFYSVDGGVTWTTATVSPVSDFEFDKVTWDGARFLATSAGAGTDGIWSSTDGISWTNLTGTYTQHLTPTPGGNTAYIGTNGVGAMRTSSDAVTWTDRYNFVHQSLTDVLWMQDRGEYLVTGSSSVSSGFIATSTDAVTWNARYTSARRTSVLWDGSRFVSIDTQGRVYTSSDGVGWASNHIITTPIGGPYNDIVWSGTRYLVVGLGQLVSSTDASTWGDVALRNLQAFVAATWNGSEFAAITLNGEFFRSTDGINWPVSGNFIAASPSLTDLAWSDTLQRYVAVASGGKLYFSDNGTAWTARSGVTTNNLRSVTWAGSQFVAVGDVGTIVTSPDGDTWTNRSITGPTFNAVAFVNGQLIAAGSEGRIFVSSDAISWFESPRGTTHTLFAIAASPTRVVAMGDTGVIVSRP